MTHLQPPANRLSTVSGLQRFGPLLGLVLTLAIIGYIYSLAWSGTLHFDDRPNLASLSDIEDGLDALAFVMQGHSGPLGRPLALATFVVQAEAWPNPRPFLMVNTLIHVTNVALVFWLSWLLATIANGPSRRNGWFALLVAACWGASPFLASASLMIVQRMATLSALFVFAGLIGYLQGRLMMSRTPRRGLLLAMASLSIATLLAVFTKESGALLPVLALVIEMTLIRPAKHRLVPLPKSVFGIFLLLPLLAIVGFLVYRGLNPNAFMSRDFSMGERLLTQSRALWDYLFNLLLPRTTSSKPFTDTFPISRGILQPLTTTLATLGLLAAAVFAWIVRKRWFWLTFGVSFFLAAHLLESTSLPLEIYFPHRNYVAAFGVYFALFFPLLRLSPAAPKPKVMFAAAAAYAVVMMAVLAGATSLWGQPELSRIIWHMENPESTRARQDLVGLYISQGDAANALALLDDALQRDPTDATLALQRLLFCTEDPAVSAAWVAAAHTALRAEQPLPFSAAEQLEQLARLPQEADCNDLRSRHLETMLGLGFERLNKYPNSGVRQSLLYAQAQFHATEQDYSAARQALLAALEIHPRVEVVKLIAQTHLIQGNRDLAREAFESAIDNVSGNAGQRAVARARLARALAEIE